MRIILASSSLRRQELMKEIDIPFEIMTKDVDETFDSNKNIYDASMQIAEKKAKVIYDDIREDVIVIGSDTVVYFEGNIYGKPKDYQDAFNMLENFSGKKHEVISSLCLLVRKNNIEYRELTYDKCDVYVDNLSKEEIDNWILNNDVYSKAGAYAIQEGFGKYITKVEGDYFSIVGFPIHKLYKLLKKYK